MKNILFTLSLCLFVNLSFGQSETITKGFILEVEGDKVYLDLNENNISVGDRLQVIQDRGFFTHPVTGEQIAREPEIVAYIQITQVMSNYSVGSVSPRNAISNLSEGMEAFLLEGEQRESREFRKSIAVQPMNVSSARGGYLGFYMADLLTEELFNIDKFMVIDRQTLGLQMDEIAMASQGIIDEKEAIQLGRTRGVDYFITGTVYEPDVIETGTGVPIKGIMQAAEAISGQRLGSEFASDVRVSQLRAIVNITLRVVDVQTGEILFIASEMQQAQGRSQINLEQGALGGLQLQGGASSFLNTITGQATKAALVNLAGYIDDYFEGKIDVRNFRGNVIEIGKVGTRSDRRAERNANITDVEYSGLSRFENPLYNVIIDRGSKTGYRQRFSYRVFEPIYEESEITGEKRTIGRKIIGRLRINQVEDDISQGDLSLKSSVKRTIDYTFDESEIEFLKYRRFIFTPLTIGFRGNGASHSLAYLNYRINDFFLLGTRFRFFEYYNYTLHSEDIDLNENYFTSNSIDIYGGFTFKPNRVIEPFINLGMAYVIFEDRFVWKEGHYIREKKEGGINFFIDLGMRLYAFNWLSFDIVAPLYPKPYIGVGLSFHMF